MTRPLLGAATVCGVLALAATVAVSQSAGRWPSPVALAMTGGGQVDVERPRSQSEAEAVEQRPPDSWSWQRGVFRLSQEFTLRQGEAARTVVSIFSPATIEGYVRDDVVVVFGTAQIASTATIGGSLIVVGGNVTVQPGASVRRDLVVVGGGFDAPPGFVAGGQHVAIGARGLADGVQRVVPWLTEGLLWGRLIVPRLGWVWVIVGLSFVTSLVLLLMFHDTAQRSANAIAARPLSSVLVGLLVLLLVGPVSVLLVASVVGIALLPFLWGAMAVAWAVGKVGVAVRIGDSLAGQEGWPTRAQSIRSLVFGFTVIVLLYMVPLVGLVAWACIAVTGLGAATIALGSAYRRENPAPEPPPPPVTPEPPAAHAFVPPPPVAPPAAAFVPTGSPALAALPFASFVDRAGAFFLDVTFVLVANEIFDISEPPGPLFLLLAYHIAFWSWKGTTPGGMICQLRVVRTDSRPLGFVDALIRGLSSLFSLGVLGLGCLWILRDPQRQAWHDKIAATYVVKVPREWPI